MNTTRPIAALAATLLLPTGLVACKPKEPPAPVAEPAATAPAATAPASEPVPESASGPVDGAMPAETTEHGNTDHGNTDHGNTDHGNTDHGNTDH